MATALWSPPRTYHPWRKAHPWHPPDPDSLVAKKTTWNERQIGIIEHTLHRYLLNTIYSPWTFGGPGNVWKGSNVTFLLYNASSLKLFGFLRTQSQCLQRCVDVPFLWWSCIATGHDLVIQWPTFSAKAKNARLGFGVSILGRTKHFWGKHLLPGKANLQNPGWNDGLVREFHTNTSSTYKYIEGFGSGLIT